MAATLKKTRGPLLDEKKLQEIEERRQKERAKQVAVTCFGCGAFEGVYKKPDDEGVHDWLCKKCKSAESRSNKKDMKRRKEWYLEHAEELQARDATCRICGNAPCTCAPCTQCDAQSYAECSCGNYISADRDRDGVPRDEYGQLPMHVQTAEEKLANKRAKAQLDRRRLQKRLNDEAHMVKRPKSMRKFHKTPPMPPIKPGLIPKNDRLYKVDGDGVAVLNVPLSSGVPKLRKAKPKRRSTLGLR